MKLFINGNEVEKVKDVFGFEIKFKTCKESLSGKTFLNITSGIQFLFGAYDLWKSKDGDFLTLEDESGEMIFEFKGNRFWLIKDLRIRRRIINSFQEVYPSVFECYYEGEKLYANFISHVEIYDVIEENDGFQFVKIDSQVIELESELSLYDELSENAEIEDNEMFKCDMKCPYNQNGTCYYFETQHGLGSSDEQPTCKEPFIYFEERNKL